MEVLRALYVCASGLHILRLLCLSRSCRGPGGNRTRDSAGAQTTRQLPSNKIARCHRARALRARERRPARSPQKVHLRTAKMQKKKHEFLHLDHADLRAGKPETAKNLESLYHDHADPRRGSRGHRKNRKKIPPFCTSRSTIKVLPRRPTNLNLTYIAANAQAVCTQLYALGPVQLALCTRLYALGSVHSALCTWLYALGSMHSALCTRLYALGSMHLALCTWPYALGSMHLALCTWLYALGSMHCSMHLLYALGSMHSALCSWLYALGSMYFALCI